MQIAQTTPENSFSSLPAHLLSMLQNRQIREDDLVDVVDAIAGQHGTPLTTADWSLDSLIALIDDSAHEEPALQQSLKDWVENNSGAFRARAKYVGDHVDGLYELCRLLMELEAHGQHALATLCLNRYLKRSDDYTGLALLNFYTAIHAWQKANQLIIAAAPRQEVDRYIHQTHRAMHPHWSQHCVAIGGLSGSGKSTLGKALAKEIGAIHIRADAVRKHLTGVPVWERAPESAYTLDVNTSTYNGMLERAALALSSGRAVILDAVHAQPHERENVENFVREQALPFTGLWCYVPHEVAKRRIDARRNDISDASSAVFEKQLLLDTGRVSWHRLDTLHSPDQVLQRVNALLSLAHPAVTEKL